MSLCKRAAIAALTAFLALPAHAFEPGTSRAANTLAMGFTGYANPADNVGVSMNPGLVAMRDRFDWDGQFTYGAHPHVGWGGSVVDARTSRVGFGLAYRRMVGEPAFATSELPGWAPPKDLPTNLKRYNEVTAAVAVPMFARRLSIGANGTLSVFNHDRQGKGSSGNLDVGIGAEPVAGLIIGLAAHELVPRAGELDHPFGVAGGVRLESPRIGALEVNGDYFLAEETRHGPYQLSAGGEAIIEGARLRGGWSFREDRQWVTGGLGAENDSGGVEYGIAVPVDLDRPGEIVHMISVRIKAPSAF